MNNLLKKLSDFFGFSRTPASHSSLPTSRSPQQSILHDGSETATRGQLVQVLLRDLVKKIGMPPGSVQCQIQVMNSRTRGQGIYVRLVVKQWDERLMKYAFAFQKALLTEIVQFEPKAAVWLHGIAWQLEVASTCPLTELPGPEFWQTPAADVMAAKAAEPFDQFDIVPLPANAAPEPAAVAHQPPVAMPVMPALPVAAVAAVAALPMLDSINPLPSLIEMPAAPPDDTAQDLERLFAIRDNELAANSLLPAGYESTEPSALLSR